MEELEKRVAKIEKKLTKNHAIDSQKLQEIMKSGLFGLACLVVRHTLNRESTDEEKVELAIRLCASGTWTVNNLVKQLIEMDRECREKEKRLTSELERA